MNYHLFFMVATLLSTNLPKSFSADDERFTTCSTLFQCGNKENIGYPFWGGSNRPAYCGYPGFELNCSTHYPEIKIKGQTFNILGINNQTRRLDLVRTDYSSNGICLTTYSNVTLNNDSLFSYTTDTDNLNLYYSCTNAALSVSVASFTANEFKCGDLVGYYVTETQASLVDNIRNITELVGGCEHVVSVPILNTSTQSITNKPGQDTVIEAVGKGFGLQWLAENDLCTDCGRSGGACGQDISNGGFQCYCSDKPYPTTCAVASDPQGSGPGSGNKNSQAAVQIGIAVGGAFIALLILWIVVVIRRRKQRKAKEHVVAQSISKDKSTPPSSKGIPISVTNFSRSTPSYPSSKSDLENGSTYFGVQVFSYTELEEATDNFDPKRELGEGGFGTVYYGELQDGRVVAVKRLYEKNFKRVEQFINEVEILTRLRHPNLVTLYGCTSRRSQELLLVYEYIPNGTVADHLHGNRSSSGILTWLVRLNIALETAEALAYLHATDIIHRDVKTSNILLDSEFRVKVADFGLSRLFPTDVTHISTAPQGTPGYVDPEYYQCYQLTDKSDVYSFGVVLIELISSKQAVDTSRHRHDINLANMAVNKIQNHTLHELVDPSIGFEKDYAVRRMTTLVAELAFRCLQQERDLRPTMEEVLAVLKGIQNEAFTAHTAEELDISDDDVGFLKGIPSPLSPDYAANDKWPKIRTM